MHRAVVVLMVLAAVAGVGLIASRSGSAHDSRLTHDAALVAPTTVLVPTANHTAIDIDAARQAAVTVVASTGDVVKAGLISRGELIQSFSTRGFGPKLAASTSDQVTQMLTSLGAKGIDGAQLSIVERPVTATATATGAGLVHVSVWSIMTVAAPGLGVGRQAWRTVEVDMRLVEHRWLVDGWTSTPGPTPALSSEAAVSSTAEVVERLEWPAATVGVS